MGVNSNNPMNVSAGVCTTLTKPTNPYEGQMVYVTDVAELQVWNGTTWFSIYSDTTPIENAIAQNAADIDSIEATLVVYGTNISNNASAIADIETDLTVYSSQIQSNASAIASLPVLPSGGTLNTVLVKQSSNDYDVAWSPVTTDGVSRSTIDAKGDLIAGTADNAVARLPVGSNGQALVADSTTATGLAWADVSDPIPLILALGGL